MRDTLELNYCTKLFHQTVHEHASRGAIQMSLHRRMVSKGYLSLGGIFRRCVKPSPLRVNTSEK